MVKSILDTDILSEYLKGHNATVAGHAARYAQEFGVFTFTSVTVHEIVYGLELKGAAGQLKKALEWLKQNEEITPTDADYLAAARIKASARKNGLGAGAVGLPHCRYCRSARSSACDGKYGRFSGGSENGSQADG